MRGRFITFEGGEGSGKSTQARLLAEHLLAKKIEVIETREPGGSPFGEQIRALLLDPHVPPHNVLSEALLFMGARADHLAVTIRPALAAGSWVICDRFTDSTRVYQGTAGGLPDNVFDVLESLVVGETRPDLTFLLDLDPVTGLRRALARRSKANANTDAGAIPRAAPTSLDAFEARGIAYHQRLRDGFLALARNEPDRIVVIDGEASLTDIAHKIQAVVAKHLENG